jgi:hypothetical protein
MVELDPVQADVPVAGRQYKIVEVLPQAWGDVRYRIKSVLEALDRVVKENEFGIAQCVRPDIWVRSIGNQNKIGGLFDREVLRFVRPKS